MLDRKAKLKFVCQKCGYQSLRWLGRCPGCNQWNTLFEEIVRLQETPEKTNVKPQRIRDIEVEIEERKTSGVKEFNRILGGGVVSGSLILIGGEPGIGKSTLLLQICANFSKKFGKVLYISGEESLRQLKMRAERLNITDSSELFLLAENNFEHIKSQIEKLTPSLVVVDSIQIVYTSLLSASPGSISQVKEVTTELMCLAKRLNIPICVVGHVTKEGSLAGPKVLEHIVDTVLYFEGGKHHSYRILRTVKNRFGPTNEIGVFEMTPGGLQEVINPSQLFLEEHSENKVGSIVVVCWEGSRPLLIELQTLVTPTSFGFPRRTAEGFDYQRLLLLIAVLEKKAGFHIHSEDVFVNIAGGIKVEEPAVDLGVILALASGFKNTPISSTLAVFGEVGLTGEVRGVSQAPARIKEALRLGFKKVLLPKVNLSPELSKPGIEFLPVSTVKEAIELTFN